MMPRQRLTRGAAGLVLACLAPWPVTVLAQDEGTVVAVEPIEDLQGRYHFTAEDLVGILSSHSLMLTSEQIAAIEDAKRAAREQSDVHEEFVALTHGAAETTTLERDSIQLDAIMYLSQERWTFWLNGDAVTPDALPRGVTVLQVTPYLVELTWAPDPSRPDGARPIVLQPGQAYRVSDGMVVEADELAGTGGEGAPGDTDQDADDDAGNDGSSDNDGDAQAEPMTNAVPGDLALSPQQVDQLSELQQALSIVSGNAEALGMTEAELQQLQQSLAASGDTSTLSAEQQEQLQRVQQATGIE